MVALTQGQVAECWRDISFFMDAKKAPKEIAELFISFALT